MSDDNAGKQMNVGISEALSGLAQTQTGLGQVKDNSRAVGMSNIDSEDAPESHCGTRPRPNGAP